MGRALDAIINFVNGKTISRKKVLEEFLEHNNEMQALVPKEFAQGTYDRYVNWYTKNKYCISNSFQG